MNEIERAFWDVYGMLDEDLYLDEARTAAETQFLAAAFPTPEFKKLIDLQCGKGRIASALLDRGYSLIGIDYDEQALNELRGYDYPVENLQLYNHSLAQLPHIRDMDGLIWIYAVIPTDVEAASLLTDISQMLRPGGRMVIDLLPKEHVQATAPSTSVLTDRYPGLTEYYQQVVRNREFDAANGTESTTYDLTSKDGKSSRVSFEHQVLSLPEATEMADNAGLVVVNVFGDFRGSEYIPGESKRLLLTMEKS